MSDKPRFSVGSKILYGLLVTLILLMFWPSSRAFLQRGLMRIGLFKPNVEQQIDQTGELEKAVFENAEGEAIDTENLKGNVVFINFWATWCGPCVAEMPSIQTLHDQFGADDAIEFMLVEIEGDMGDAKAFMQKHELNMPVYIPAGNIPQTWLGGAIPSTIVLDKNGSRVFKHEGMADYSEAKFVEYIKNLVTE